MAQQHQELIDAFNNWLPLHLTRSLHLYEDTLIHVHIRIYHICTRKENHNKISRQPGTAAATTVQAASVASLIFSSTSASTVYKNNNLMIIIAIIMIIIISKSCARAALAAVWKRVARLPLLTFEWWVSVNCQLDEFIMPIADSFSKFNLLMNK